MKITCNTIQDLLPLYHEGICHTDTQKLVQAHLETCVICQNHLKEMKKNQIDTQIKMESENMITNFAQTVKKQTIIYGLLIAMLISVVPPFVVNLAVTGGHLDWFYIVLTATLLFGAITLTPLILENNKAFWTLLATTANLLLLLFAIYSYTSRGEFAANWYPIAAISTILTVAAILIVGKFVNKR